MMMMMKKGQGQGQGAFELKQRVVVSLKKVGDRDTQQMGSQELERIAETLSPDGIAPFLSCITTDSDADKPPLRRECVRLIALLARSHHHDSSSSRLRLLAPHLPKMVSSVLRRLKDPDSLVRDACVETCGVLAKCYCTLTFFHHHHRSSSSSSPLVDTMVRPLFQSLGEQNRYVQAGSALCLARVIDCSASAERRPAAPLSPLLLPQMLPRLLKLLKNPHFMAKPDLIFLITTILQHQLQLPQTTGGEEDALSAALHAILEALKSSDWTTRKAASVALAALPVNNNNAAGPLLGSFKTACITYLETCRFDKVKPVRDAIMHALQSWKSLPVTTDSPQPSETGSSTKENMTGVYHDSSSASDGRWTDASFMKTGPISALSVNSTSVSKRRDPLAVSKLCPNYVPTCQEPNPNIWHTEISLPKTRTTPLVDIRLKESDGQSCTKEAFARTEDAKGDKNVKYVYDPIDDESDCSSVSDIVSEIFETKCVAHDCLDEGDSANLIGNSHRSITEEDVSEGPRPRVLDHKSLDSTVTALTSHDMHRCCLHASNELAFIKKQLLEIETKQSNLLDLLQVFMNNSVDDVSTLHFKFHNLEHAVDRIAHDISHSGSYPSRASSNNLKKNNCSSRLSTSTPRPSVESNCGQPSLLSLSNKETWGETAYSRSQSSTSVQEGTKLRRDPTLNITRNTISKSSQKTSGRNVQNSGSNPKKEPRNLHFIADSTASTKKSNIERKSAIWKKIKELLCAGDTESAYVEVLCTGDDLVLLELMDRTGPVLERLSHDTVDVIISRFSTLTRYFQNQRFTNTIFPWFQQASGRFK
ncbi:TORTIFOLIA1-like protein 2 isoform X1 [Iris pallida]|uniref:TORTIFOLIA1-like protein 2 isoform X1 n=1 Tax=Iris pallida TaxID=29817 RepID=A0AAX6GZM7_IRIPA|nr:TORTIFOLIA1-like protein 2 isoform X1 [Iris pallida]